MGPCPGHFPLPLVSFVFLPQVLSSPYCMPGCALRVGVVTTASSAGVLFALTGSSKGGAWGGAKLYHRRAEGPRMNPPIEKRETGVELTLSLAG